MEDLVAGRAVSLGAPMCPFVCAWPYLSTCTCRRRRSESLGMMAGLENGGTRLSLGLWPGHKSPAPRRANESRRQLGCNSNSPFHRQSSFSSILPASRSPPLRIFSSGAVCPDTRSSLLGRDRREDLGFESFPSIEYKFTMQLLNSMLLTMAAFAAGASVVSGRL